MEHFLCVLPGSFTLHMLLLLQFLAHPQEEGVVAAPFKKTSVPVVGHTLSAPRHASRDSYGFRALFCNGLPCLCSALQSNVYEVLVLTGMRHIQAPPRDPL